jgi:cation:H+ antiporter
MRTPLPIALALLAAVPAFLLRFSGLNISVELGTLGFGVAVAGAAFAISWAAEAAERDIPRALALTAVAFLAVLPEYAVDIVFAFKAGQDASFAPYAAANMTGSNRLLLGLGWPTVAVLTWLGSGQRQLRLNRAELLPLGFLAVATVYSFTFPLKAAITSIDTLILIGLFVVYAMLASRAETAEPDLIGPAAAIGDLPTVHRRIAIAGLFAFAGATIGVSAEPFADGLVRTGQQFEIDEFLLVQWLAPLASETPELLIAALLTLRGKATAALGLLLSAKINQWTLLVGSLPLSYSLGAGELAALPLDQRQVGEVLLTAAQSLFGVAVLASMTFELAEAGLLAALFAAQLILGGVLRAGMHDTGAASTALVAFAGLYVFLAFWQIVRARHNILGLLRDSRHPRSLGSYSEQPDDPATP